MKAHFLFLILLLFITTSCGKDDISKRCCSCERPATQQGANTMSFKINGEQWSNCNVTNDGSLNDFRTVMVNMPYGDNSRLDVQGRRNFEGSNYELLNILIDYPKVEIITNSPQKQSFFTFYARGSSDFGNSIYANDTTKPYHLNITKVDWNKRIISGEFECEMEEVFTSTPGENLLITQGRFDVSF
ncbi:MAG: hypothetical protein J5I59_07385 [Saprospiraceae bacterium]|nr:hypothetical protein [Saprospiraceae bacterium]